MNKGQNTGNHPSCTKIHFIRANLMNWKHLILGATLMTCIFGCGKGNYHQARNTDPPDYKVELDVVTKHWDD